MRTAQRRLVPRAAALAVLAVLAGVALAGCEPVKLAAGQLGVDGIEVTQSVQYPVPPSFR